MRFALSVMRKLCVFLNYENASSLLRLSSRSLFSNTRKFIFARVFTRAIYEIYFIKILELYIKQTPPETLLTQY